MKKTQFLLLIPVISCQFMLGQAVYSFSENWKARIYQKPVQVSAKSLASFSTPDAVITVDVANKLAPVLPTQFGANTTFRNGPTQRSRSSLYNGIITSMRFPAGSGSNTYFWDGNIPSTCGNYIDQTGSEQSVSGINALASNAMTPDIFVNFKKDINGEPVVVVNYFYARYGLTAAGTREARVKQAADYAAGFVRRMNVQLGAQIKYWEIGNECYGKWEVGFNMADTSIGTVTGKEYGEDFCVFAKAMKAVDSSIKIGAVVTEDLDDPWNAGVLPQVKDAADFLSFHEYFTTVKDASASNILASVSLIASNKSNIEANVVKYTGKPAGYFPIAMTEFNSRGPYNCTMINGLFISQILGEIIKSGIGYSCIWVSEWSWSDADQESKGMLAVKDPEQDDYTARQAYVPYYYYSKCFGDSLVSATSTSSELNAYASTFSSGETGVVLVNTSASARNVRLRIRNGSQAVTLDKCQWYEFYATTIEPTDVGYKKFYINGQTSTTSGGGPADLNTVVPFESTVNANITLTMQPYSVYFIVATPVRTTSVHTPVVNERRLIPSVLRSDCRLNTDGQTGLKVLEIYDSTGRLCWSSLQPVVNVSRLKPGYYYLKALYDNEVVINRFLKA